MRHVHWKRLLLIVVVFVVVCGSTFALNRVQIRRQAGVFRERAEQAQAAAKTQPEKRDEAIQLYEQYLKFRPQDEAAQAQYVRLILDPSERDLTKLQHMANVATTFLKDFPNNHEDRRQLVEILIKKGELNGARDHLAMLYKHPSGQFENDPDLLDKSTRIAEAERKYTEALEFVDRAIVNAKDPAQAVKAYAHALNLLRLLRKDTEAALRIATLQKKQPYSERADARVVVVRHLLATREYPMAREQVAIARSLPGGENNVDVLLMSAEVELSGREPQAATARVYLEKAFALDPKRVDVGALLSEVLSRQGHREEAVAVLTKTADALPEVKEEFYAALDKLIDLKDTVATERLMGRLTDENTRPFVKQYFRGRLELAKGNWPLAKSELEACAPFLTGVPHYHKKLRSDLGECYSLSHNPDQMLESYRLARRDDPNYTPAKLGYAEALVKLGRIREAVPIYKDLVREIKSLQPTLARLVLLDQISRPLAARDWRAFEDALGPPPYSTELLLLKAEALNIRHERDQAIEVLKEASTKDPSNPAVSLKSIKIQSSEKVSAEEATRLIEQAEKQGDSVDFRLAKVGVLQSRSKKPTVAELRALAAVPANSSFTKPELYRLWFGLGDVAARQPDAAMKSLALEFYQKAAEADPLDLVVRAVIIDLAISMNKEIVWEKALREIADAEGPNGPIYNLGRIAIRLRSYTPGDKDTLRDLRKRAEAVQKSRPAWSRAYLALAQIDELEGLNDSALQNLLKAIELGDKQDGVIRKAVNFLRERKLYEDAAVLLNKMHTQVTLPDDLQRFRAIMNLLTTDSLQQEVKEIDQFAPADSPTYEMQLLRGTLLAALREDAKAEEAFRKALEKVPSERPNAAPLEAWSSLVVLLVRTERLDVARQAVAEAQRKLRTTPPKMENLLTLAGCNEAIRDIPTAEKFYREIYATNPNDLDAHKQLIHFLQRTGRGDDATGMLRQWTTHPGPSIGRWARRHLAVSLMMTRDAFKEQKFALGLVEQNLRDAPNDPEDRKALAIVLTVDPTRRAEGMKILSEYGSRFELTPDEYYLLSRLYFDQGRFDEAQENLRLAIRHRPNVSIEHLAGAVQLYLSMGELNKAAETADRLQAIAPKSWETTAAQARVLHRRGRTAEARDLVLAAPNALSDAFIPIRTGPLLDEIGAYSDVEKIYTQYLEKSKAPGAHIPLATFYIARKQIDKALDLAHKYESRIPVSITARILSGSVRTKMPAPDRLARVESWLTQKLKENESNRDVYAVLVGAVAELRDAQGRFDDAIEQYQKALRLDAQSDVIVNNLAMLLALHRPAEAEAAKTMIDDLIGIRGPAPTFLDTRAVASLVQGANQPAEAVKDLKLALAQQQKAVYYFHLAWAYDLQRLELDKQVALQRAVQLGISTDDVHPKELPKYYELLGRQAP